jgi:leucyl-tRNA synthetase
MQKSGGETSQWDILRSMGVPEDEIPRFADSAHWLRYFPPLALVRAAAVAPRAGGW